MLVGPVDCAARPEALLALVYSLGTSFRPNHDTLSCGHLLVDKFAQFLHGDSYSSDESMRYKFNELLSNQVAFNVIVA